MNNALSKRRAGTTVVVVTIIGLATVLGTATLLVRSTSVGDGNGAADRHVVRRGSFDITIPTSGELAALHQIEIRNKLKSRGVLTEIVAEGTTVKEGDVLMRFADEDMRSRIKDAKDAVNTAESNLVSSQAKLDITVSEHQSELANADLRVMLAELALKAWRKGEVVSRRKELAVALEAAEIDYERAIARFEDSKNLVTQDFISQDEYKRDEIAKIKAKATLEQAKLDIEVYEQYRFVEQKAQRESDVEQAFADRERVKERQKVEVESARSEVASKTYQHESRKERLADYREQLEYCTIRAPSAGLVVYYSSLATGGMHRSQGQPPDVGTELRPNEQVILLPDMSQLIAAVKVNEALSGLIKPGQPATVTSDALPDTVLHGEVINIGVLAESGGWRDPNRRDYTVRILLSGGTGLGLKPSMRCKADINVGHVEDALFVPIQAIFRDGPVSFVYVPKGSGFAERQVMLGDASELFVQINDGLAEGDVVLLREPSLGEIVSRIDKAGAGVQQTAMGAPRRGSSDRTYGGSRQGMGGDPSRAMRGRRPAGMRGKRPEGRRGDAARGDAAQGASDDRSSARGGNTDQPATDKSAQDS
ncbi:MAG: HlyD family efflux transporter periplasmic adaptor subunit [Planctomycetes bacterium]|nr:HlyD family efflux transporter periplasmic adaptor subunit [Planctomycetota bacterium]